MKVLVTGGAGYIGSVTVKKLQNNNVDVVVLDNLATGCKNAVSCPLVIEDLTDKQGLCSTLDKYNFDAVIHLAAYARAEESVTNPYKYLYNNVVGTLNLLEWMKTKSIKYLVYSSSCAVYGATTKNPIKEGHPKKPTSAYGESKLICENLIARYSKIYNIKFINLRYFNVAGATLDGKLGNNQKIQTRIIPVAIKCLLSKHKFIIFGKDYNTADGTSVKDYIHVEDVAKANVLALKKIVSDNKNRTLNICSGKGFSNLEIVKTIQKITKSKINYEFADPRLGDVPIVYGSNDKAVRQLSFTPKHSNIKTVIETQYRWQCRKNN